MNFIKVLTFIFLVVLVSCKTNKNVLKNNCNNQFKVLDSISYVVFPNDNWGTMGNTVFKKIKSRQNV